MTDASARPRELPVNESRFRKVAQDFYVAPQLQPEDFAAARALGIRTIINNRPDGEAPDQLSDAQARAQAEAAGLSYAFVPVVSGNFRPESIEAFAAVRAQNPGPYLAYCRSGTRSCYLWAFTAVRAQPVHEVLEAAAAAGYDLAPARPILNHLAQKAGS